eukprot:m.61979 g.61979  ORF g.61979 m.61979 type:complete len:345 (-) comp8010_c0_seq1:143-1177(-)
MVSSVHELLFGRSVVRSALSALSRNRSHKRVIHSFPSQLKLEDYLGMKLWDYGNVGSEQVSRKKIETLMMLNSNYNSNYCNRDGDVDHGNTFARGLDRNNHQRVLLETTPLFVRPLSAEHSSCSNLVVVMTSSAIQANSLGSLFRTCYFSGIRSIVLLSNNNNAHDYNNESIKQRMFSPWVSWRSAGAMELLNFYSAQSLQHVQTIVQNDKDKADAITTYFAPVDALTALAINCDYGHIGKNTSNPKQCHVPELSVHDLYSLPHVPSNTTSILVLGTLGDFYALGWCDCSDFFIKASRPPCFETSSSLSLLLTQPLSTLESVPPLPLPLTLAQIVSALSAHTQT